MGFQSWIYIFRYWVVESLSATVSWRCHAEYAIIFANVRLLKKKDRITSKFWCLEFMWLQLKVELLPVLNFDISQEIWKYHISMFRNDGFIFYMECLFAYIYNMLCLLLPCEKNQLIISNGKKVMNIWKMQFLVTFLDLWTLVEIIIWASWPLNISESRQHITSKK